jgi:hypothetical protein
VRGGGGMMGASSGLDGRMLRKCRRAGGDMGVGLVLVLRDIRVGVGVGGGGGGGSGGSSNAGSDGDDDEECRDENSESFGRLIRDGICATTCLGLPRVCFTLRCAAARG